MVSLRNIRTALAVALLASTALGQIDWGQKPLAPPPGRHGHALVYDAISRRVVLFGGQEGATAPIRLADTWEWNGREWVQRLPTQSPEARSHHAMAYHGSSGSAFLFGGRSANGAPLDDTWTWSSGVWTRKRPALQPPARAEHALCWDRARDVLVVYGGVDAAGMARDDTWTWNGTDWSQVTTNAGPIGNGLTMTFDEARGTCLLFAGSTAETWGFDGVQWTQRMPASSPSARTGQSMAYDSTRHVVVLTGGESTTGVLDDAWEWDGTNWTPRVSAFRPTARTNAAIAYDAARGSMLLFGGRDPINARSAADTWSFDGQT
ncbi:MAG: hypothetical protein H6834_18075, partial [Planctomycetes bacterium]|nr:hypothetical protein [Planctomycetota bacterium]